MAENINFEGCNKVYVTSDPEAMPGQKPDMWVFHNGWVNFSRWVLSPEELAEINKTGEVCLAQILGKAPMAQTYLGSRKSVQIATMDYGAQPPRLPKLLTFDGAPA